MSLKYITFDNLMASVESDLHIYANQSMIDRSKFIKEVRKVNAELGLRINSENQVIIKVKDYKAELPDDFHQLQLALVCHMTYTKTPILRGTQSFSYTEESEVPIAIRCQLDACEDRATSPCGNHVWLTKKDGNKVQVDTKISKLSLTKKSAKFCTDSCLNFFMQSSNQMSIENGYAHFSFRNGDVYINYIGDMTDEDGNLLVLDHPIVSDYYEYAVKAKFFENAELNKEGDFFRDWQLVSEKLRVSRIRALTFINTIEYDEIIAVYNKQRRDFYKKYISYFDDNSQGYYNI